MKKLLFLIFLLPAWCYAQLTTIAESTVFDEPEAGYAKIILLKNGNTAFIHITKKDGINLRLYNKDHQEIVNKKLNPPYGKLKAPTINGIYEIEGNIVAFISEYDDKTPTLYRLTINDQTGELIETQTIATLMRATMGQGYAVAFGHVPMPEFLVRKDPYSNNYGVVRFNSFVENREERVELMQYGASGKELYKTFLSSPNAKYKYTQILDFVIIGADAYVLLYSYNTDHSGGTANELLLASVKNGSVTYQNLGNATSRRIDDGLLRYNPKTGNMIFLTLESLNTEVKGYNKTVTNYAVQFSIIDPNNATIKQTINTNRSSIASKYKKIFKGNNSFSGLPEQLYINDDGSFTVLSEEVTNLYHQNTSRFGAPQGMSTATGSELGTAAVVTYDENGTEISSQIIPLKQTLLVSVWDQKDYTGTPNFYIALRDNNAVPLSSGNQFKSFAYLNGKNKSYILLNDVAENEERIKNGKLTNIRSVGDCDGYMYDLSLATPANGILPRSLVFDKEHKKDRNLAIFSVSDFDRENGIFATLKLEKGKGVKVVWMKD